MSFLFSFIVCIVLFESILFSYSDKRPCRIIFYSCFVLYTVYMYLFTFLYVGDPSKDAVPIGYVDQIYFWDSAQEVIDHMTSLNDLFNFISNKVSYVRTGGLYFALLGIWYKFGDLLGGSNIYTMKLLNVWAISSALVFLYLILRLYFEENFAKYFVLVFAFLSHSLFLSQPLLRDNFITLLFFSSIYICLQPYTKSRFIILIVLVVCCLGLRIQNGVILLGVTSIYCLNYTKEKSNIRALFYVPIGLILLFLFSGQVFDLMNSTIDVYSERDRSFMTDDSLSKIAYYFPPGLRQIVGLCLGILLPFPFATSSDFSFDGILYFIFILPERIAVVFSIYCLFFIVMSKLSIELLKQYSIKEKLLFTLSALAIVMSSVEYEPRRVMCLYPLIYLLYCKCFILTSKDRRKIITLFTVFLYLLLHVVYFVLKA